MNLPALLLGRSLGGPIDAATGGFAGSRMGYAAGSMRYTGELQFRLKDDFQALNNWFIEGVATWLINDHWELVPDLRLSIYPGRVELRPGIGAIRRSGADAPCYARTA